MTWINGAQAALAHAFTLGDMGHIQQVTGVRIFPALRAAGLCRKTPQPPLSPTGPPRWRDEESDRLPPGKGIKVNLLMQEREIAAFEWTANGYAVNCETHENHGWFWRNRTDAPVTVTLRAP